MKLILRNVLLVTTGLLLGAPPLAHGQSDAETEAAPNEAAAAAPAPAGAENLPLEDLRVFTEVVAKVKSDYVEDVRDKTLLENSIKGMINGLLSLIHISEPTRH